MPIAIFTARIGSKRLKKKNIKSFFGKPVIYYPIAECKKVKSIKKIIVSTDNQVIANIVKKFGAKVPFLRSKKLSNDYATTIEVIRDTIKKLNLLPNNIILCVYPVTPLLKTNVLEKALKMFRSSSCIFLIPVIRSSKKKGNKLFNLDKKEFIQKKINNKKYYKDAGQFYIGKAKSFLKEKSILFSRSSKAFILNENSTVDVNTLKDWNNLKKLYLRND